MKSVKKIKSVASALSVIDFEHLWSSRSDEHVNSVCVGTVFQTNLAAIISECINKTNRIKHQ